MHCMLMLLGNQHKILIKLVLLDLSMLCENLSRILIEMIMSDTGNLICCISKRSWLLMNICICRFEHSWMTDCDEASF
jgi:hypothetical protein